MVTFGPSKKFYTRSFVTPERRVIGEFVNSVPILAEMYEADRWFGSMLNSDDWKSQYDGLVLMSNIDAYGVDIVRRSKDGGNSWTFHISLMEEDEQREMYGSDNQSEWLGLIRLTEFREETDADFVSEMIDQIAEAVLSFGGDLKIWPKDWGDSDKAAESEGAV